MNQQRRLNFKTVGILLLSVSLLAGCGGSSTSGGDSPSDSDNTSSNDEGSTSGDGGSSNTGSRDSIVLQEDFSSGFTGWTHYGSPSSQIVNAHNKQNVFDNNGDSWCPSGVVSEKTVDATQGLVISADVYLEVSDYSGCWVSGSLGLTNGSMSQSGSCSGESYKHKQIAAYSMKGDQCHAADADKIGHSWLKVLGKDIEGDAYTNGWHRLKAEMDSEGYVDLYIDGNHVGRSSDPVDSKYRSSDAQIWLGKRSSGTSGKAYMDNVEVAIPTTSDGDSGSSGGGGSDTSVSGENELEGQWTTEHTDPDCPGLTATGQIEFRCSNGTIDSYLAKGEVGIDFDTCNTIDIENWQETPGDNEPCNCNELRGSKDDDSEITSCSTNRIVEETSGSGQTGTVIYSR